MNLAGAESGRLTAVAAFAAAGALYAPIELPATPLRIGVLLDGETVPAWVARILEQILAAEFAAVTLVVLNSETSPPLGLRERLRARFRHLFYLRYVLRDTARRRGLGSAFAPHAIRPLVPGAQWTAVEPKRRGYIHRLARADLNRIRRHGAKPIDPAAPRLSGMRELPCPQGHFYADPMLHRHEGRTWLLVEDFDYRRGKGCLVALPWDADRPPGPPQTVLDLDVHLSYPFVFEWRGDTYLVPESANAQRVSLYRARRFPDRWELVCDLLQGNRAVDATLREHEGRWYLFAKICGAGGGTLDELFLFHADTPMGPFRPHPANPLISDVRRARPAGRLFQHAGRLIRPSQDCARSYGNALVFNQVLELSARHYREQMLGRLAPDWAPGLGLPHLRQAGRLRDHRRQAPDFAAHCRRTAPARLGRRRVTRIRVCRLQPARACTVHHRADQFVYRGFGFFQTRTLRKVVAEPSRGLVVAVAGLRAGPKPGGMKSDQRTRQVQRRTQQAYPAGGGGAQFERTLPSGRGPRLDANGSGLDAPVLGKQRQHHAFLDRERAAAGDDQLTAGSIPPLVHRRSQPPPAFRRQCDVGIIDRRIPFKSRREQHDRVGHCSVRAGRRSAGSSALRLRRYARLDIAHQGVAAQGRQQHQQHQQTCRTPHIAQAASESAQQRCEQQSPGQR